MPNLRLVVLTVLTMIAFAGNSLLCRVALKHTTIDAASFAAIRFAQQYLLRLVDLNNNEVLL